MRSDYMIVGIVLISLIMGTLILVPDQTGQKVRIISQGTNEPFILDTPLPASPSTAPMYKVVSVDSLDIGSPEMMAVKTSIPSEAEAPAMAEMALDTYGGLPKDAVLGLVERVTLKKINTKTGETEEESPQWTSVHYKQQIDGLPVIGPGAAIIVDMGEQGKPLSIMKGWRTLEYAGETSIISPDLAFEKLKKGETLLVYQTPALGFSVSSVELGYYAEQIDKKQAFYTPVWIFYAGKTGEKPFPYPVDAMKTQ